MKHIKVLTKKGPEAAHIESMGAKINDLMCKMAGNPMGCKSA